MLKEESLTKRIIASAIEVHRTLGPGLLESVYEICLCHELKLIGLNFVQQLSLPIEYKGIKLDAGYRIDLVVENKVIIEIKAVKTILPVHEAQLLTYMKLTGTSVGLLLNFNEAVLKDGIVRRVI